MRTYTENALIQQRAIDQFAGLGYEIVDASYEQPGKCTTTGRQRDSEVVLAPRLRAALQRLNQNAPADLIDKAIEELTRDRSILSLVRANEEIYGWLKNGVKIDTRGEGSPGDHSQDNETQKTIRIIDWDVPEQNDFLLVSHFCVSGKMGRKCIDLLGFVNGLPLIVIELQASRLKELYEQRISDYKQNIPQLFWYNALIILSNGDESKLGSLTTPWEHFFEWKRIRDEKEPESTTLETMVQGTCEKNRFLDIVENFTLFSSDGGGLKLIARNHQFLGVNNVFDALRNTGENRGKLGVFWHTQGSGKSYSMIFFSQKVLRKVPGDWTFVVVTDREDLDKQIYGNFQKVGAVIEPEKDVHAKNGKHLQRLLRENHRTVFTLIQKFRTEKPGQVYKKLSDRSDIIVMTDEAHRTQYDILARNMRDALPKASFIGFTGTPLVEGEKETRETFGDYISIYNFRQSIKDKITVPLYYENRTPEVELTNLDFNVEMEQLLDEAMLSDEQEQELSSQFPREYHVLVQDNRLDRVAEDIVEHFMNRG